MCVQTFYGHNNAVHGVAFNQTGDLIASCDSDGIVKLWDVRAISERATLDCGDRAVNKVNAVPLMLQWCVMMWCDGAVLFACCLDLQVTFDRSGKVLAAASDDGEVKLFNVAELSSLGSLRGHEDSVQVRCAVMSPTIWAHFPKRFACVVWCRAGGGFRPNLQHVGQCRRGFDVPRVERAIVRVCCCSLLAPFCLCPSFPNATRLGIWVLQDLLFERTTYTVAVPTGKAQNGRNGAQANSVGPQSVHADSS